MLRSAKSGATSQLLLSEKKKLPAVGNGGSGELNDDAESQWKRVVNGDSEHQPDNKQRGNNENSRKLVISNSKPKKEAYVEKSATDTDIPKKPKSAKSICKNLKVDFVSVKTSLFSADFDPDSNIGVPQPQNIAPKNLNSLNPTAGVRARTRSNPGPSPCKQLPTKLESIGNSLPAPAEKQMSSSSLSSSLNSKKSIHAVHANGTSNPTLSFSSSAPLVRSPSVEKDKEKERTPLSKANKADLASSASYRENSPSITRRNSLSSLSVAKNVKSSKAPLHSVSHSMSQKALGNSTSRNAQNSIKLSHLESNTSGNSKRNSPPFSSSPAPATPVNGFKYQSSPQPIGIGVTPPKSTTSSPPVPVSVHKIASASVGNNNVLNSIHCLSLDGTKEIKVNESSEDDDVARAIDYLIKEKLQEGLALNRKHENETGCTMHKFSLWSNKDTSVSVAAESLQGNVVESTGSSHISGGSAGTTAPVDEEANVYITPVKSSRLRGIQAARAMHSQCDDNGPVTADAHTPADAEESSVEKSIVVSSSQRKSVDEDESIQSEQYSQDTPFSFGGVGVGMGQHALGSSVGLAVSLRNLIHGAQRSESCSSIESEDILDRHQIENQSNETSLVCTYPNTSIDTNDEFSLNTVEEEEDLRIVSMEKSEGADASISIQSEDYDDEIINAKISEDETIDNEEDEIHAHSPALSELSNNSIEEDYLRKVPLPRFVQPINDNNDENPYQRNQPSSTTNENVLLQHKSSVASFEKPAAVAVVKGDEAGCLFPITVMDNNGNGIEPQSWKKGKLLGEGSFGQVFQGLNEQTGELLAAKQIGLTACEQQSSSDDVIQLQREIQVMWDLNHVNIVRYIGTSRSERYLYILLEYIPGGSIASMLSEFGPFSESLMRKLAQHILTGVEYLHSKGIIHRDIKGANVLVTDMGVAKLSDFGCSKQLVELCTTSLEESLLAIRGSVPWMAPEVIKQSGFGRSSDIWSVGATMIEMATGKPPLAEFTSNLAALFHVATSNKSPPIPDHLPPSVKCFIQRCMVVEPRDRANAEELLQDVFLE